MKHIKFSFDKNNIYIGVVILLIFIIGYFICNKTSILSSFDGFTSDQETDKDKYKYLAPVTEDISDILWTILVNKMKKVNPNEEFTFDKVKHDYTNFITKEEINYYLQNGIFPWSTYVTNIYKTFLSSGTEEQRKSMLTSDPDIETMLKSTIKQYPNRYAYKLYLSFPDVDITVNLEDDGYLIFSGEKSLIAIPITTSADASASA